MYNLHKGGLVRTASRILLALLVCVFQLLFPAAGRCAFELSEALKYLNGLKAGEYPVPPAARLLESDPASLHPQAYSSVEYPEFPKYVASLQTVLNTLSDEALSTRSTEEDYRNQQRAMETLVRLSVDPQNLGVADIRETLVLAMTYDIMSGLSDAAELEPGSKTHEVYSELLLAKLYNLRKLHSVWEVADATGRDLQYPPVVQIQGSEV